MRFREVCLFDTRENPEFVVSLHECISGGSSGGGDDQDKDDDVRDHWAKRPKSLGKKGPRDHKDGMTGPN